MQRIRLFAIRDLTRAFPFSSYTYACVFIPYLDTFYSRQIRFCIGISIQFDHIRRFENVISAVARFE